MEYYSAIKKKNIAICNNMDAPGGCLAKYQTERQIWCIITYMWNIKNKTKK